MGTTSAIFTGSSQFSQDFSSVVSRAVQMASLPVTQLQAEAKNLQAQSDELSAIDAKFVGLQASLTKIGDAMGGSSFQTSVSNEAVVTASVGEGAVEGT